MTSRFFRIGALLAVLGSCIGNPAFAQEVEKTAGATQGTNCLAPQASNYGQLSWFLGFHPSDDLTVAWCRIQNLPGNVRFNVRFPISDVHKSWDTSFNTKLPAGRIVEIIQTMLPVDDSNQPSDTGVPFGDVLARAVQLQSPEAPDGSILGFAPDHPAANKIVLWEPLALRVKPVVLAGQPFTLSVYLKPNMGMLALAMSGQATDVRVRGWSGRFQTGNYFKTSCSAYFPDCKNLKSIETLHLPLLVDTVRLEAEGENMTAAAIAIGQSLYARNSSLIPFDPMQGFNRENGSGGFTIHDDQGKMEFEATGLGGTKKITITYTATDGQNSILKSLKQIGEEYRAGTKKDEVKEELAPDSLGKL